MKKSMHDLLRILCLANIRHILKKVLCGIINILLILKISINVVLHRQKKTTQIFLDYYVVNIFLNTNKWA